MKKRNFEWDTELLFLGFMLFLFAPLEIYFSNINDLWFSVYDFAGYLLVAFVLYIVVVVLVDFFVVRRIPNIWGTLVYYMFLLGLSLYIQGNFILVDYGQMDGQPIDWSLYKVEGIVSVGLFALIFALGTFLWIKMGREQVRKVTKSVSIFLILVQFVTLITVSLVQGGFTRKEDYIVTTKNEWVYSQEKNFNILVLDAFDSRVFNDLLNGECKEEVEELFEDFTYYRNTTTVYPLTDLSIPQIITGENYLNQEAYGDYLNHSYMESPLLNQLQEQNYKINIYQNIEVPDGTITSKVDNWEKTRLSVSSHKRLLGYIYKLVGFRYLPQPLKETCWFYSDDMDDMKCINYVNEDATVGDWDLVGSYDWANKLFYENIEKLSASELENVFHFYHLKGLHVVRNLDKDFNDAEEVSLEETAKGMFNMLGRYFDELKTEGIYDNSIIIIMADHAANEYPGTHYKQCPLLLVKGVEEEHPFKVTDIPVSYADLQVGYKNLLNQTNMDNIFEIQDENRERYLYQTEWLGRSMNNSDYGANFEEYVIKGNAFDSESIVNTGKVYSGKTE